MGEVRAPKRIQRRRTKGWRMPEGAVYVGRPSRWGNPYAVETYGSRAEAVRQFRQFLSIRREPWRRTWGERGLWYPDEFQLVGLDLACWCPLDQPCHADVLLEIANATDPSARPDATWGNK